MVDHIRLFVDNREVPTKFIEFSDGAVNFVVGETVPETATKLHILVDAQVPIQNILQEIAQVVNTFPFYCRYSIHFDYMPYARADRIFGKGQCHALATFIQSLVSICPNIDKVSITDPHSPVTKEVLATLLDPTAEIQCIRQAACLHATLPAFNRDYDFVVAPDAGARDKAREAAEVLQCHLLTATKSRDPHNGRILSTELPEVDLTGMSVIIVDDICDGGGTFIPLAQALREAGAARVDLYVTHGIFSKGLDVFAGHIDKIFCYQTVGNYVTKEQIWSYNKSVKEFN